MITYTHSHFTKAKEINNEDKYGYNETTMVVVDGATDKSGKLWDQFTGGQIASDIVVETCLLTSYNGMELVECINTELQKRYQELGNTHAESQKKYRFNAVFVCMRIQKDGVAITQVGNVGYRIDLGEARLNSGFLEDLVSKTRANYIGLTHDVVGARRYIKPLLQEQFYFQNNEHHILGYGCIDGWPVPNKFVMTETLESHPQYIEIFTDGYYGYPKICHGSELTIAKWEEYRSNIEQRDPYKIGKTSCSLATKTDDDRTILIAKQQ